MRNILVIFHDNNLNSGATKSFLSNIEYLISVPGANIYAIVPQKEGKLVEYLKKRKIEVVQITYGGNVYGVYNSRIKTMLSFFRGVVKTLISYCSYIKIKKYFKEKKIDCVYTNTSTIYLGAWIAKALKIRHIWHFREFGLEDQGIKHIFSQHFVSLINSSEKIIMISKILQSYYYDKYGVENSIVIYNDISDKYIMKKSLINKKSVNILITGTLCENKGQLFAIKVIEQLEDENIHLYIAGKENEYGNRLKNYVKERGVKNIHFCGMVEDMNELRKKMDFSLVCAAKEAFGRTIIEDMLAEIVVIACNEGAIPELISDNYTGIIYSYNDLKDVKLKIEKILYNEENIYKIRKNAFEYALKYTKCEAAKKISDIL